MKTTPGYIIALLLPLPGLAVYFLNPNSTTTMIGGLILNLAFAALVFYFTIPQELAIGKFKRYAKESSNENRNWLISALGVYLVCGILIIFGIQSGFLRFLLFLFMWGGAIAAGEFSGFFVWRAFNKEWVAKELAKDAAEAETQEKVQQAAQELASQRAAEQQKAQTAAKEKAAQQAAEREKSIAQEQPQPEKQPQKSGVVSLSDQERVRRKNRGEYMENMVAGLTAPMIQAFQFHISMVQSAAADSRALAGVEEAIARLANHQNIFFYRPSGSIKRYSQQEIQEAYDQIIHLARRDALLADPALTQALALIVDAQGHRGNELLNELPQYGLSFQAYQLLGLQFTLSNMNQ